MGHIYGLGGCHIRIDYTSVLPISFIQQKIIGKVFIWAKKNCKIVKNAIYLAREIAVFFEVTRCKNL